MSQRPSSEQPYLPFVRLFIISCWHHTMSSNHRKLLTDGYFGIYLHIISVGDGVCFIKITTLSEASFEGNAVSVGGGIKKCYLKYMVIGSTCRSVFELLEEH